MKDTVQSLLESAVTPAADIFTKNRLAYRKLNKLNESAEVLAYTADKVIVNKARSGYLVEFSGNIERLMRDQEMEITEAMELVAAKNGINVEECTLVLDEAAINVLNIDKVLDLAPVFAIATK